jgi:hypothetical protein
MRHCWCFSLVKSISHEICIDPEPCDRYLAVVVYFYDFVLLCTYPSVSVVLCDAIPAPVELVERRATLIEGPLSVVRRSRQWLAAKTSQHQWVSFSLWMFSFIFLLSNSSLTIPTRTEEEGKKLSSWCLFLNIFSQILIYVSKTMRVTILVNVNLFLTISFHTDVMSFSFQTNSNLPQKKSTKHTQTCLSV